MLNISNLCKSTPFNCHLRLQVRHKTKVHWSKLKKKTSAKYKALDHFNDFYGSVFGDKWEPMREAMLRRSKYVALINNYGDPEETMEYLTNRGAHCLKKLMLVQQEFDKQYTPTPTAYTEQSDNKLTEYVAKMQVDDISSIYPQNENIPERLDVKDITLRTDEDFRNQKTDVKEEIKVNKTLDESLAEAQIDESRIIDPGMGGVTSDILYQYIPATKLKGMDEWLPESLHYSYYNKDKDFPLIIEPETEFTFPEHLKVFTYEKDSEWSMFPDPKRCKTGVFNYYPLDGGSVAAGLALCTAHGDRVLDMCAAPGGKALVQLQTLLPQILVCNDTSISRSNRLQRVFRDYLHDFETSNKWRERVLITRVDGKSYIDDQGFDKVLVDVPCTTDRLSVNEDENNIFRADRIKERLKIPELQSQLLANALRLVKVGGAVVYSTCSLSPIQNDGVVHMALKQVFETDSIVVTVKDLTIPMAPLRGAFEFGSGVTAPKYGQLIVPSLSANFGPSYISRLVRVK